MIAHDVWDKLCELECCELWQWAREKFPSVTAEQWDEHVESSDERRDLESDAYLFDLEKFLRERGLAGPEYTRIDVVMRVLRAHHDLMRMFADEIDHVRDS